MRSTHLPPVVLSASLLWLGCGPGQADKAFDFSTSRSFRAEGMQSMLVVDSGSDGQELTSITQLAGGACLSEEASLDRHGRVVHARATLSGPGGLTQKRVELDALRGTVEVSAPSVHVRWNVPADLPWTWSSLLAGDSGQTIATPLGAMVAHRGAAGSGAVRELNLDTFQTHTVMADQLLVSDGASSTVVLGDDAAEVAEGLPRRIHLAAFDRDLETIDDAPRLTALAAFVCAVRDSRIL